MRCARVSARLYVAVIRAFDRAMRRVQKALEMLRQPVIPAGLATPFVHTLLHDAPLTRIGHDEGMQVKIVAVLHGCAVDLGNESAGLCERHSIDADTFADTHQFLGRPARMRTLAATNMNSQFALERRESALECAEDTGRDAGRMPVHAHDGAERLKPERMCEPAQHFLATIMVHDRFDDDTTESCHSRRQPRRNMPAMQRKIGTAGAMCHDRAGQRAYVFAKQRMEYALTMPLAPDVVTQITLEHAGSGTRARVAPGRGALVTSFCVRERELLYLDATTFADSTKNVRGGIPILFPTPGKLADDVWRYGDLTGVLKQHGFARNLAWTLVQQTASTVTLELASNPATLEQYPWQFLATLQISLGAAKLRLTLRVENRSATAMPFALGYHPYFLVTDKQQLRIDSQATRAFDNVSKQVIPFNGFDFTRSEVDLHLLDHGSDVCVLRYADGSCLDVRAAPDFGRWVIWTLAGKDFVCVEPWTAPGNALNTGEAVTVLTPAAAHESWVEIALRQSVSPAG